jgi:hypothetical protein
MGRMVDLVTARRLALALPEVTDGSTDQRLAFDVAGKGFAWSWNERVHPKKPRVPRLDVLAVRCAPDRKEVLLDAAPERFFQDDHYAGYPAVLVRLDAIDADELSALFAVAWRLVAPKPVAKRHPEV